MLLFKRRFLPFFITQFLGAFNDNLFKNALLVYLTFTLADSQTLSLYTNLSAALFIAPMFLFSAWSGLLADRFEKHGLIVKIKLFEVIIMVLGVASFMTGQVWLMLIVLCLLGLQSTFFGPVKYGILPERLHENELMLGNGLVEAGTFLAILIGTLLGAYLVGLQTMQWILLGTMMAAAVIGLISAWFIPRDEHQSSHTTLPPFKPWQQTVDLLRYTAKNKIIFQCILSISWFWLLGGALLTQIPQFSRDVLGGDSTVVTYLLVLFSAGVGLGSLAAHWLSRGRIEPGLVPFGGFLLAIGLIGIITVDQQPHSDLINFAAFFDQGPFWHTTFAFFGLAFAGGIYVVPLYALIQSRAEKGHKSQVIAANNIINSLFLVIVSLLALTLLSFFGWTFKMFFILLLILHVIISFYIFITVPEFVFRVIIIAITGLNYRMRVTGREHIPEQGAAFIICNHVSYMDPLMITAICRRPIRFVMYHKIYNVKALNWFFRMAGAIPIAPRHECNETYERAMQAVNEALKNGELVGIFPEGKITLDGTLQTFREGIVRMLEQNPVPIVPMALGNMWGSFFSHKNGICKGKPGRWLSIIPLTIGKPLPAETSAAQMQETIAGMLKEQLEEYPSLKKPVKE
ncbi:MFS transporter [Cardiobacteriaceae bacterium TAE3-ERU3]|nr:MFS transporter [Cardiobacteriaceae bacterium TAE3-ERU3]